MSPEFSPLGRCGLLALVPTPGKGRVARPALFRIVKAHFPSRLQGGRHSHHVRWEVKGAFSSLTRFLTTIHLLLKKSEVIQASTLVYYG